MSRLEYSLGQIPSVEPCDHQWRDALVYRAVNGESDLCCYIPAGFYQERLTQKATTYIEDDLGLELEQVVIHAGRYTYDNLTLGD